MVRPGFKAALSAVDLQCFFHLGFSNSKSSYRSQPYYFSFVYFQQVEKQKQIEEDLLYRISQLEKKQSEDDVMLCGINRYWKIFDENCRLFAKQFETENDISLFDKSKSSVFTSTFDFFSSIILIILLVICSGYQRGFFLDTAINMGH